jgi:hypothetical protein
MGKYLRISSYTVSGNPSSYMTLQLLPSLNFLIYEENLIFLFISVLCYTSREVYSFSNSPSREKAEVAGTRVHLRSSLFNVFLVHHYVCESHYKIHNDDCQEVAFSYRMAKVRTIYIISSN